jgi:hypothetical protein
MGKNESERSCCDPLAKSSKGGNSDRNTVTEKEIWLWVSSGQKFLSRSICHLRENNAWRRRERVRERERERERKRERERLSCYDK